MYNRAMFKIAAPAALAGVLALTAVIPSHASSEDSEWVPLFNGKNFSGWRIFQDPQAGIADPSRSWMVREGEIVCTGRPTGYLITEKEYGNYRLRLQWRWGDAVQNLRGPNSGVILHVQGADKLWPRGVEVQLASTRAGDFWIVDGFALLVDHARLDARQPGHVWRIKVNESDQIEKPLGQWNECEITCQADSMQVAVNGFLVNAGSKAELQKGRILLQSEGTPIHFRRIEMKPTGPAAGGVRNGAGR